MAVGSSAAQHLASSGLKHLPQVNGCRLFAGQRLATSGRSIRQRLMAAGCSAAHTLQALAEAFAKGQWLQAVGSVTPCKSLQALVAAFATGQWLQAAGHHNT